MYPSLVLVIAIALLSTANAACITSSRQPCVYKQLPSCPNYDLSSGVVTCPVSCPNLCSCSGTSTLCNCGAPQCTCFLDTADVCKACKPQPSPVCSCLAELDLPCNCETKKSFIYFPETTYPLTILEMNPFYTNTCYSY